MSDEKTMKKSDAAAGMPRSEGERSEPQRSGIPAAAARVETSPTEVRQRATRRRFGAAYKQRILAEADRLEGTGEIGALLRREGLYSSHLAKWRRERDAAELAGLAPRKRGPKVRQVNPLTAEVDRLNRENARLAKKLKKAEAIIDFQKKVAALLAMDETDPSDTDGSAS